EARARAVEIAEALEDLREAELVGALSRRVAGARGRGARALELLRERMRVRRFIDGEGLLEIRERPRVIVDRVAQSGALRAERRGARIARGEPLDRAAQLLDRLGEILRVREHRDELLQERFVVRGRGARDPEHRRGRARIVELVAMNRGRFAEARDALTDVG